MKNHLALALALLFGGSVYGQQPAVGTPTSGIMPPKLGAPTKLKKYRVKIRRFDPRKGLESGEERVLPVDCIDEEHAVSAAMSNAVSFTTQLRGTEALSVAFACTSDQERK